MREQFSNKFNKFPRKSSEKHSALTDRGLGTYEREFGLTTDDLRDKSVLDIGSGKKERFAKEAAEYGATVFSVNPKLREWKTRRQLQGWLFKDKRWQRKSVAARGQQLPFRPESFDLVTASWSISYYLEGEERWNAIKEVLGVLKPGGKLYLAPRWRREDGSYESNEGLFGQEELRWLEENGYALDDSEKGVVIISRLEVNIEKSESKKRVIQ